MHIVKNAKYIRVPNSTKGCNSRVSIYAGGSLRKTFFITQGEDKGYTYYPLYRFGNEEVIIDYGRDIHLEDELMIIM